MCRPHQIVTVDDMDGDKMKRLEEDKLANDGEKLQVSGRQWWNDTIERLRSSGLGTCHNGLVMMLRT